MTSLSPEAQRGFAVLHGVAAGIVAELGQLDLVSGDRLLDAAMTAHALHLHVRCGVAEALDAFDSPMQAAGIAKRLDGLTMAQSEAVRCICRTMRWGQHFGLPNAAVAFDDARPASRGDW